MEGGRGVLAFVVHAYTRHFLAFGDGLGSCFRHLALGVVTCHSLACNCSRILVLFVAHCYMPIGYNL